MLNKLIKANPRVASEFIELLDSNLPELELGEGSFACSEELAFNFIRQALQLEYQSWLTYFTYGNIVKGLWREGVASLFLEHAEEELGHARSLLLWLTAHNSHIAPDLHFQLPVTFCIKQMIQTLWSQEQEALKLYIYGLKHVAGEKEGFRQLLETIIEKEQEHALELKTLVNVWTEENK